ncbi:ARL14 effector protein-like [Actinia tenebrosa]|uniref:ARL14 effector protein-like n=1 Tax=Actinia tenebrosa TaxID=6105 RepID=A0A6P8J0E0_ACTTE|nr:ARL14 effector protein-like [Actinia tenebrosa]
MDQESKEEKDSSTCSNEYKDENIDGKMAEESSNYLSIQASGCTARRTSIGSAEGDKTEKLLKILQFRNPGPQLASFDPDKSRREQRKVRQFVRTTDKHLNDDLNQVNLNGRRPRNPPKRRNYHDRSGIRLSDNKDVCDCQDLNCPGCHFPCDSCGSEKCGVECRCSRRWTYEPLVQIENPFVT